MWHGAKTANITVKRALLMTWFFVLTVAHGLSGVNKINASSEFKLIPCIICSNLEFPVIGPNLPVPSVDDIPGVLHKTCGSVWDFHEHSYSFLDVLSLAFPLFVAADITLLLLEEPENDWSRNWQGASIVLNVPDSFIMNRQTCRCCFPSSPHLAMKVEFILSFLWSLMVSDIGLRRNRLSHLRMSVCFGVLWHSRDGDRQHLPCVFMLCSICTFKLFSQLFFSKLQIRSWKWMLYFLLFSLFQ